MKAAAEVAEMNVPLYRVFGTGWRHSVAYSCKRKLWREKGRGNCVRKKGNYMDGIMDRFTSFWSWWQERRAVPKKKTFSVISDFSSSLSFSSSESESISDHSLYLWSLSSCSSTSALVSILPYLFFQFEHVWAAELSFYWLSLSSHLCLSRC